MASVPTIKGRIAFDASSADATLKKLGDNGEAAFKRIKAAGDSIADGGRRATQQLQQIGARTLEAGRATERFREALHVAHPVLEQAGVNFGSMRAYSAAAGAGFGALAAAASGAVLIALAKLGDEAIKIKQRLSGLFESSALGSKTFADLQRRAKDLGTDVGALAGPLEKLQYASTAGSAIRFRAVPGHEEQLPGAQNIQKQADVVETLEKAMRTAGASQEEAARGADQFTEALKRQAEAGEHAHLTVQMVQQLADIAPGAANALAKAFGKQNAIDLEQALRGGLIVTIEQLIPAINRIKPAIDAAFADPTKNIQTFEAALEEVKNEIENAFKELAGQGVGDFMIDQVRKTKEDIKELIDEIKALGAAWESVKGAAAKVNVLSPEKQTPLERGYLEGGVPIGEPPAPPIDQQKGWLTRETAPQRFVAAPGETATASPPAPDEGAFGRYSSFRPSTNIEDLRPPVGAKTYEEMIPYYDKKAAAERYLRWSAESGELARQDREMDERARQVDTSTWKLPAGAAQQPLPGAGSGATPSINELPPVVSRLHDMLEQLATAISGALDKISSAPGAEGQPGGQTGQGTVAAQPSGQAEGGPIGFADGGRVLAAVSHGEYNVEPEGVARAGLPALNAINAAGRSGGGPIRLPIGLTSGGHFRALPAGPIRGPGTSKSDSILAALRPGGFVVNAAAHARVGTAALDAITGAAHGGPIKLADGGPLLFAAGGGVADIEVSSGRSPTISTEASDGAGGGSLGHYTFDMRTDRGTLKGYAATKSAIDALHKESKSQQAAATMNWSPSWRR